MCLPPASGKTGKQASKAESHDKRNGDKFMHIAFMGVAQNIRRTKLFCLRRISRSGHDKRNGKKFIHIAFMGVARNIRETKLFVIIGFLRIY